MKNKKLKAFLIVISFVFFSFVYLSVSPYYKDGNFKNIFDFQHFFEIQGTQKFHDTILNKHNEKEIWKALKDNDPKNIVKSFKIIEKSIKIDPGAGHDFDVYINNNKKIVVSFQLSNAGEMGEIGKNWGSNDYSIGIPPEMQEK